MKRTPQRGKGRAAGDGSLENRFLTINRDRLRRVRDNLTPRQRDFVDVLPLLFHINHPLLPGYVSQDVPTGISDYSPSQNAVSAAKHLSRSFAYERRSPQRYAIQGLYMMGSPGTVAYSRTSDLDMWLCHDPGLEHDEVAQLSCKAARIERCAGDLGLEVHFFVFDAGRFRQGQTLSLSDESSGSSQHYLLLDEFYRSGLLVAGLKPLWWRVPSHHDHDYDAFVANATAKRLINRADYLDFGSLASIPAEEFYGAAVWQLYKSIQSPYKSVLKLLLMEAYASEYPDITLLSRRYKQKIEAKEAELDDIDPYILMYAKVEEHLNACGDHTRLEVLRRSFYLKTNERLSQPAPMRGDLNWRREVLTVLTTTWGWSDQQIARLDDRYRWKIGTALEERRDLINTLKQSYAGLSQFAREHSNDSKISERDLHTLGRKLYSAFERKPAKVEVVTRGICPNPSEPHLSLHEISIADDKRVWLLFSGVVKPTEIGYHKPLKRSASATEILLWCHLNRLAACTTTWHIFASSSDLSAIEAGRIMEVLEALLPGDTTLETSQDHLDSLPLISAAKLLVNVGTNAFKDGQFGGGILTTDRTDAFNFSGHRISLLRSIDLVFTTTWSETFCFHYEGAGALMDALVECLHRSMLMSNENPPPMATASCFSSDYGTQIGHRVERTFNAAVTYLMRNADNCDPHYVYEIEDQLFHLYNENGQPHAVAHASQGALVKGLTNSGQRFNKVRIEPGARRAGLLPEIYQRNRPGHIQIFAQECNERADVYIIDDHGAPFVQRQDFFSMAALLGHLREFVTAAGQRCVDASGDPGLGMLPPIDTTELITSPRGLRFITHRADSASQAAFLSINVFADADSAGHQHFTIYCNQEEFCTLEFGGSLFVRVAEFVLAQRTSGETYPIYISDLDLSTRFRVQSGIDNLRPIHLLNYKKRIEYQLTRALRSQMADVATIALAS